MLKRSTDPLDLPTRNPWLQGAMAAFEDELEKIAMLGVLGGIGRVARKAVSGVGHVASTGLEHGARRGLDLAKTMPNHLTKAYDRGSLLKSPSSLKDVAIGGGIVGAGGLYTANKFGLIGNQPGQD